MKILHAMIAPALLVLTACGGMGGGEDFAVEVGASPAAIFGVLSSGRVGDVSAVFPGIAVVMSRPSDNEILYTIPMKEWPGDKGGKQAMIRFRLEPGPGGKGTMIHATADVPPIRVLMGKANMALSEDKVERELKKIVDRLGTNASAGSGPLSDLLVAVAIAGNADFQARANDLKRNPGELADLFGDLPADGEAADPDPVEPAADREPVEPAEPSEDEVPVE